MRSTRGSRRRARRCRCRASLSGNYTVEVRSGGVWRTVAKVSENMLRHRIHEFPSADVDAVRVIVDRTWGDPLSRILEIRVYGIIQANSQVL